MKSRRVFFPRSSRALLGVALLLVVPALTYGQWKYAVKGPLETLAWIDEHRGPRDSAAYASALYHAGHARASHDRRWSMTGYATIGLTGTLVGLALLLSSLIGRSTSRSRR